jgi:hypothetical protein
VLFNKEKNLLGSNVAALLVPYDVILLPTSDPLLKPTLVTPICVTTNVDKSLIIFNVTCMVIAPTNLESPTMMLTTLSL